MEPTCTNPLASEIAPPRLSRRVFVEVGSPLQVLLVEDDPDAAELARCQLMENSDDRFRVEWSSSLLEAMGRLGRPGIDVVLLDLGMPELNGYKSFRAIESVAGKMFPIVILTADERDISRQLTLGFGASEYLVKQQTSSAELRQALRSAVLRSRL